MNFVWILLDFCHITNLLSSGRALFEKHGFEVINVKSTFNCYSLGFFAERAPFLSTKIKKIFVNFLKTLKILNLPVSIPVGNIGIVARKRYDRT